MRHVFAHLGAAPYRFVGHSVEQYQACPGAPIQPGTCCDHCGTGISDVYRFESADGNRFKVGSTCVEKAGDRGLVREIAATVNRIKGERKAKRDGARIVAAREVFAADRGRFEAEAHPMGFRNRETGETLTMADWLDWTFANAGMAGRVKAAKMIEEGR